MAEVKNKERLIEIDLLRTIAIISMIFYHLVYDLSYFYGWEIDPRAGVWSAFARSIGILFLLLVGTSFVISSQTRTKSQIWKRSLQRGGIVLGCAIAISVITYTILPTAYIRFGILHCIGTSLLLIPFFRKVKECNILLGIIIAISMWNVQVFDGITELLLPFNIVPKGFMSLDYYPLFPWFGFVLIGMGIGHYLYVRNIQWRKPFSIFNFPLSILTWPGRHALIIYLVHQPMLMVLLWLILGSPVTSA